MEYSPCGLPSSLIPRFNYDNRPNNALDVLDTIEDDIYPDFVMDVEEILKNVASEEEKNEIIDYLWFIFEKRSINIIKQKFNYQSNTNLQMPPLGFCMPPNQMMTNYGIQPQLPNFPQMPSPFYPQPQSLYPLQPMPYNFQPAITPMNNYFMNQQPNMFNLLSINPSKEENKKDKKKDKDKDKDKKKDKNKKKSKDKKKDKEKKKDKKKAKSSKKSSLKKKDKDKPKFTKKYTGIPFEGIFNELTQQNHGNIHDNGIINISGNICDGSSPFSSIVDFNFSGQCYNSNDDPNSYICFDFKNSKVSVTAYTIKSSTHPSPDYLQTWVIEGSDNKVDWTQLDSHTNDTSLCSNAKVCTFLIRDESKQKQKFRYIQLRMTGPSDKGNDYLDLLNIEFFGSYYQEAL